MSSTKTATATDTIKMQEDNVVQIEETTLDEYRKLNEKCDQVLQKIKSRKKRTKTKGE